MIGGAIIIEMKKLSNDIEKAIQKIEKIDKKQKELEKETKLIRQTSPIGQHPPVLDRIYEKIIKLTEKKAEIWNKELRNKIVPGTTKTFWQLAIERKLPVVKYGKERYLDFYANDIRKLIKKQLGSTEYAWDKNRWRPILEKRRIERGKHKGKFRVVFPDKKERIVDKTRNIGGLDMDGKGLKSNLLFLGLFGLFLGFIQYKTKHTFMLSGTGNTDLLTTGIGIGGRPRFGRPKTDEERRLTHYLRYETTDLPPRGTGLLRRGLVY